MNSQPHDSVPGLDADKAGTAVTALDGRLVALTDLHLTLKHIHWNVVGPNFLSVHEMLDTMVGPVREMTDEVAERMRTLGGVPVGTPAAIVAKRTWEDYGLLTESVYVHLKELDAVFDGVITDHRSAIAATGDVDPVTEDLLIAQTAKLEQFQWFVRSFFERAGHEDSHGEVSSATAAADRRAADKHGSADREPTEAEERAAQKGAQSVDEAATAEHYQEMTSVGADAKGEGRI